MTETRDYTTETRAYTTQQVAKMAHVCPDTVRQDIERGLIAPITAQRSSARRGPALRFTAKEAREYAEYRAAQSGRPMRRLSNHANRVRIIALCRKQGIKAVAHRLGIATSSLRRNLRNWRKAKYAGCEEALCLG